MSIHKEPLPVNVCFWGAYCAHAILTNSLGVYNCPFGGACFKRFEKERVKK